MNRLPLAAAFAIFCTAPAFGNDAATCARIDSLVARLACYDKIAPETTPRTPPEWTTNISVDPMTDEITTTFRLEAADPETCSGIRRSSPALAIQCTEQEWTVIVQQGCTLGIDKQMNLLTRHDDQKPVRRIFINLAREDLQIPDPASAGALVSSLTTATEFRVRIESLRDYPAVLTFQVAGLSEAIKASGAGCRMN